VSELSVPTIVLDAEVLCADGRTFNGRIFLPAAASTHSGEMRPEEWMNDAVPFFPFLPEGERRPVLMNKHEVLVLTVAGVEDPEDVPVLETAIRRVAVETRDRVLRGTLVLDMPATHSRVLDFLNTPHLFLTVREGDRRHLVRKARITRVVELQEE
jgi:hypothetical protein